MTASVSAQAKPEYSTPSADNVYRLGLAGGLILYSGGIWNIDGCGSSAEVGLQYVVCSPANVLTFVSTGAFSFTLVQTSVMLGFGGSVGIDGSFGAPGALGAGGAPGMLGVLGACGAPGMPGAWGAPGMLGMLGLAGGAITGSVNRLPSTSWPSIIDLPRSSICIAGGFGIFAEGACGMAADGAPAGAAGMGKMLASFFKWSSRMVRCEPGSEMMLAFGVSKRILPSLERHMREADCDGGPPPAG